MIKTSGATVRCLKGYTSTAIGLAVADITNAIIRNTQEVKPVSTLIQVTPNETYIFSELRMTTRKFPSSFKLSM